MVEFVVLGVLMLVPLVYLVVVLGRLQAGAFAVQAAASAAARSYAEAPASTTEAATAAQAATAVRLALSDQGFDAGTGVAVAVSCAGQHCRQPGTRVVVTVRLGVVLPAVPALLDRVVPVRVPVESTSAAVVDRFTALPAQGAP